MPGQGAAHVVVMERIIRSQPMAARCAAIAQLYSALPVECLTMDGGAMLFSRSVVSGARAMLSSLASDSRQVPGASKQSNPLGQWSRTREVATRWQAPLPAHGTTPEPVASSRTTS